MISYEVTIVFYINFFMNKLRLAANTRINALIYDITYGGDFIRKTLTVILCFIMLSTTVLFISCSSNTKSNTNSNTNNKTSENSSNITDSTTVDQTFTLDQLKSYNGKDGSYAYVAVDGVIYDVTNATRWKNGNHEDGIVAGVDLTASFPNAPHGKEVLTNLPVIGSLAK